MAQKDLPERSLRHEGAGQPEQPADRDAGGGDDVALLRCVGCHTHSSARERPPT
jgi:hypothetical protein